MRKRWLAPLTQYFHPNWARNSFVANIHRDGCLVDWYERKDHGLEEDEDGEWIIRDLAYDAWREHEANPYVKAGYLEVTKPQYDNGDYHIILSATELGEEALKWTKLGYAWDDETRAINMDETYRYWIMKAINLPLDGRSRGGAIQSPFWDEMSILPKELDHVRLRCQEIRASREEGFIWKFDEIDYATTEAYWRRRIRNSDYHSPFWAEVNALTNPWFRPIVRDAVFARIQKAPE